MKKEYRDNLVWSMGCTLMFLSILFLLGYEYSNATYSPIEEVTAYCKHHNYTIVLSPSRGEQEYYCYNNDLDMLLINIGSPEFKEWNKTWIQ